MPARFSVFEHATLREGDVLDGHVFAAEHRSALERAHRDRDFPYYRLVRGGVQFCQYVGVFQAGGVRVEVLPKADRKGDRGQWRDSLLQMLQSTGSLVAQAPSMAALCLAPDSILDAYLKLFVAELDKLMHHGLIRRFRSAEGNLNAMRGALRFGKHIQQNHAHQERFYVRYLEYTSRHPLHAVLLETLNLVSRLNTTPSLRGPIAAMLLAFPEQDRVRADAAWFARWRHDRKSEPYRAALDIARLLLLNFHPDLRGGRDHVLALMFDMNVLWEKFVLAALRRHLGSDTCQVFAKSGVDLWQSGDASRTVAVYPDIVVREDGRQAVLDTKWKIVGSAPSVHDLRQMYAYSRLHGTAATALVYPGEQATFHSGSFMDDDGGSCGMLSIPVSRDIGAWQATIADAVRRHLLNAPRATEKATPAA